MADVQKILRSTHGMKVVTVNKEWRQMETIETKTIAAPVSKETSAPPSNLARVKNCCDIIGNAWRVLFSALLALGLFVGLWAIVAHGSGLPGPVSTWNSAMKLFSDPFYQRGPNDQGIGWNVLRSLSRVGMGFGLAAIIGIPLGFLIGRFAFLNKM